MLTVEQVMGIISDKVAPLPPRAVTPGAGGVLAQDVRMDEDSPRFDRRSWMDLPCAAGMLWRARHWHWAGRLMPGHGILGHSGGGNLRGGSHRPDHTDGADGGADGRACGAIYT